MIEGAILAGLGALATLLAFGQPAWLPSGQVGPGLAPRILAAMLVGVGLLRLWRGGRSLPGCGSETLRPALLLAAAAIGFAVLLPRGGFLAASMVCVFVAAMAAPGARPGPALFCAGIVTGSGAALFVGLLGLPLRLLPAP